MRRDMKCMRGDDDEQASRFEQALVEPTMI
jgi:hypothetical protein